MQIDGIEFNPGELLVFRLGSEVGIQASTAVRMMLLGGEPMDGPRYIFCNFVSSSKERLEEAKADWGEGRLARVPQETEFIPLPEESTPVRYP